MTDESDKEIATFAQHLGLFEFNVMTLGLLNALTVFQVLMLMIMQCRVYYAIAYLDEIMFYPDFEGSFTAFGHNLDRLQKHDLILRLIEAEFDKM